MVDFDLICHTYIVLHIFVISVLFEGLYLQLVCFICTLEVQLIWQFEIKARNVWLMRETIFIVSL